jgi:hypothetical protein
MTVLYRVGASGARRVVCTLAAMGDDEAPAPDDDLVARFTTRDQVPADVLRNREVQRERDRDLEARYAEAISANIAAHRIAINFLDERLQWIADHTDLDLVGDTRHAAAWQMCGRIVGLARLMLDALELGYTAELMHLARAMHEAGRLLFVFQMPDEGDLVRQWLTDDEAVMPRDARAAEERFQRQLDEAVRAAGGPEMPDVGPLTRRIYGEHSEAAHHRRRWTQDAVFPDLRAMIRGSSGYWLRRAGTVAAVLPVVEEGFVFAGDSLASMFFGVEWFGREIRPLQASFDAVRRTSPLR